MLDCEISPNRDGLNGRASDGHAEARYHGHKTGKNPNPVSSETRTTRRLRDTDQRPASVEDPQYWLGCRANSVG